MDREWKLKVKDDHFALAQSLILAGIQVVLQKDQVDTGRSNIINRLSCYSKNFVDERDLSHDITSINIFDLSSANHVHRFVASNRPLSRVE
jgi:hypothetical protein